MKDKKSNEKQLFCISVCSLFSFILIAYAIHKWDFVQTLDQQVYDHIQGTSSLIVLLMSFVTQLMSKSMIAILTLGIITVLFVQKRRLQGLLFGSSILGGVFLTLATKSFFQRLRPATLFVKEGGYSFPSGHAFFSVVFFFLVFFLFQKEISVRWRKACAILAAALTLLIGASRIILGVHWLSDVLGGYALGVFWLTLMLIGLKKY